MWRPDEGERAGQGERGLQQGKQILPRWEHCDFAEVSNCGPKQLVIHRANVGRKRLAERELAARENAVSLESCPYGAEHVQVGRLDIGELQWVQVTTPFKLPGSIDRDRLDGRFLPKWMQRFTWAWVAMPSVAAYSAESAYGRAFTAGG